MAPWKKHSPRRDRVCIQPGSALKISFMRLFASAVLLGVTLAPVFAQTPEQEEERVLTFEETVNAFAIRPPDEASPFFADRELARRERRESANRELTGAMGPNETAIYPRVRGSENSAAQTFTGFFTNMFSSIRINPFRKRSVTWPRLELEPEEISLSEQRQIDVTYTVNNDTRKMVRLDFPTSQRIELIASNEDMEVIERWSDDRVFEEEEGIVFINPGERISYTEPVSTREMKPGQLQTISVDLIEHPEFSIGKQFTPAH